MIDEKVLNTKTCGTACLIKLWLRNPTEISNRREEWKMLSHILRSDDYEHLPNACFYTQSTEIGILFDTALHVQRVPNWVLLNCCIRIPHESKCDTAFRKYNTAFSLVQVDSQVGLLTLEWSPFRAAGVWVQNHEKRKWQRSSIEPRGVNLCP